MDPNKHMANTLATKTAHEKLRDAAPDLLEALQLMLENAPKPQGGVRKNFSWLLATAAASKAILKATK